MKPALKKREHTLGTPPARPRPPRVVWESRGDRGRSKNHRAIKQAIREIVADVWARMPLSACIAIDLHPMECDSVYLFNDPESENDGRFHFGNVLVNVDRYRKGRQFRERTTWVLAHEFAHACVTSIALWAKDGWANSNMDGGLDLEKMVWIASAFLHGSTFQQTETQTASIGEGETQFTGQTTERIADAIAIAWGFGKEYASDWAHCEDGHDAYAKIHADYLAPEILAIHRVLLRKRKR